MTFEEYISFLLKAKGKEEITNLHWWINWNTASWFPVEEGWKIMAKVILSKRK